jgi:protein-disulfide isomerase
MPATAPAPEAPHATRHDAARTLRREREAAVRRAQLRRRAWSQLLFTAVAAAAVVAAMIVAGDATRPERAAATSAAALRSSLRLEGIPQRGSSLGSPTAPVTVVEFADLQCPFCATFDRDRLPAIVARYVRTGMVRIELRLLAFLGEDSVAGARAAADAAGRDRLWQFADRFYRLQGAEGSGYVDDAFLRRIDPLTVGADPAAGDRAIAAARAAADAPHVTSTPSFAIGDRVLQADELDGAIAARLRR